MPLTSPLTPAQNVVRQDTSVVHNLLTQMQKRVNNGVPAVPARPAMGNIPAQAEIPAISAEDYKSALGSDLAIFQSLFETAL